MSVSSSTHTPNRAELLSKESILELLSDAEVGRVSKAEAGPALAADVEYIDLGHLDRGVQRTHAALAAMPGVVPKDALEEATWKKILAKLAASRR